MRLNRNEFLESLVKDSPNLRVVFLNHSGSPATLLSDLSSIDLLAEKATTEAFKNYCLAHQLVQEIIVIPEFKRTRITVSLKDGSQLNFKLVRNMIKQSLTCLPENKILKEASINDYGMLVPATYHHFEYLLLKCQFENKAFPDKFQKYFSALDGKTRTSVFVYVQPRYNLIINTLEDLYIPTGKTQIKLTIGLRRISKNSLFLMLMRSISHLSWMIVHLFWKKELHLFAHNTPKATGTGKSISKHHAGQAIL